MVEPGMYRHYKGGVYEVLGVAKRLTKLVDGAKFLGTFRLIEIPERCLDVFCFPAGEIIYHNSFFDWGDRVIYQGQTGRWARKVDDFLSLTKDGQVRFTKIDEDVSKEVSDG